MKLREFHINEFPQDRIFVLLDKEYHYTLFDNIKKNFGFKRFNSLFFNNKLNRSAYELWQKRKSLLKTRVKFHFIPLWFIVKLSEVLNKDVFSIKEIEEHITAYKGPSTSSVITSPNLPLVEDGRLVKITAHLIGDGHVDGAFGTNLPKGRSHSEYRNFTPNLLNQFEEDLKVFGSVALSKNYRRGCLIVPNVIGYILKHIYKIEFDCFNSRVPAEIYRLPKKIVANFIRAFADDESHVYDNHISFYSANKKLLEDFIRLFNTKFPEIKLSELKVNYSSKNPKYYFYVLSESRKTYLDLIGFDHPGKKEDLVFNVKRGSSRKQKNGIGKTKEIILRHLQFNKLTAKNLSRKLGISHGTIIDHLNRLKDESKVKIVEKGKKGNFWRIS